MKKKKSVGYALPPHLRRALLILSKATTAERLDAVLRKEKPIVQRTTVWAMASLADGK